MRLPSPLIPLLLVLAAAMSLAACKAPAPAAPAPVPTPGPQAFSFAVVGDMPYGAAEVPKMDALIAQVNADPSLAFVIHVGDIKGGSEPCSDELLAQRAQQIRRITVPVVFTPGDNEWTDCHRAAAGRHLPTERLAFLRRLFFADPTRSIGNPGLALTPQSAEPGFEAFVENTIWRHRGVLFAAVHVVGSGNGLEPWAGADSSDSMATPRADRIAEVRAREAAALAWIDRAFDRATAERAAAVVLAWQANPVFERAPGHADRAGFDAVIARLQARAIAFGRPVLLVHGDWHEYLLDRPLPAAPNVVRVQTFGSPRLHWVKVQAEPGAAVVFRVAPVQVPGN